MWLFKTLGSLAYRFKITKFTPWHFGAFPHDSFFDPNWVPEGFSYLHTSENAFMDTWDRYSEHKEFKKNPLIAWLGIGVK